jgi:hypothetical protein
MSVENPTFQPSHADKHRAAELKWRGAAPGMPPALADEFMAAIKTGKTVYMLTSGKKEYGPALATPDRFKDHCNLHPGWAVEVYRISKVNGRIVRGARLRNLTHCAQGHPFSGANLKFEPSGRRRCMTCIKRRETFPPLPSEEQIKNVTAALNSGKTIGQICWGKVAGEKVSALIVPFRNLKRYRQLNPGFDKFVVSAMADHNSRGQRRRYQPERVRIEIVRCQNEDFQKIVDMVPAYLPPDVRNDIAQSIFVALFEGALQRDQARARVQHFVADNRMFPTKYAKFGDSPLVSLDEVLFEDGSATRGDTVSRGLWD